MDDTRPDVRLLWNLILDELSTFAWIRFKNLRTEIPLVINMARGHTNPGAFVLEIIGSLIYLFLVYFVSITGYGLMNPLLSGQGSLWLPILYATAFIGAVLLFITSFGNLTVSSKFKRAATLPAVLTGFALVTFTAGTNWLWLALVGFVLAIIGVGISDEKS